MNHALCSLRRRRGAVDLRTLSAAGGSRSDRNQLPVCRAASSAMIFEVADRRCRESVGHHRRDHAVGDKVMRRPHLPLDALRGIDLPNHHPLSAVLRQPRRTAVGAEEAVQNGFVNCSRRREGPRRGKPARLSHPVHGTRPMLRVGIRTPPPRAERAVLSCSASMRPVDTPLRTMRRAEVVRKGARARARSGPASHSAVRAARAWPVRRPGEQYTSGTGHDDAGRGMTTPGGPAARRVVDLCAGPGQVDGQEEAVEQGEGVVLPGTFTNVVRASRITPSTAALAAPVAVVSAGCRPRSGSPARWRASPSAAPVRPPRPPRSVRSP